jgi:hypothetical protein
MKHWLIVAAALVAVVPVTGCGGPSGKSASVVAGDMPAGETWSGVYFHQVYGNLNLVEQDNNVIGKWQRADKSAWGKLSGTKIGNVLHFTWTEHKYGMVGPSASISGKGYFVYKMGPDNIGKIEGQYGYGEDEVGATWDCVKQMAGKQPIAPDLNSISGETPGGTDTNTGFH